MTSADIFALAIVALVTIVSGFIGFRKKRFLGLSGAILAVAVAVLVSIFIAGEACLEGFGCVPLSLFYLGTKEGPATSIQSQ